MDPIHKIKLLIPDLPAADCMLPWLRRIDAARRHTNFGPLVRELEAILAGQWPVVTTATTDDLNPLQVVTLSSGTAALELGIAALGIREGGEVLLPAFTFPATASAVLRNGLCPVFGDVATDTWQLTPAMAREATARRPLKLVIPVATLGAPLDVASWDAFMEETGIPVLLDAAAAFGNQAVGRMVHAAFSLHATKPFGIGEGGLLATRDAAVAARVRVLSNFGFTQGKLVAAGTNAKLSEYAAAVGLAQWARWSGLQTRRKNRWAIYRDLLSGLPRVRLQRGFESAALPAQLLLHLPVAADMAASVLANSGIETRRWYCPPLQQHPAFAACSVFAPASATGLPVTEQLAKYTLGMPWHNFLQEKDMLKIVETLRALTEKTH